MSPERNATTCHVSRFLFARTSSGSLAILAAIRRALASHPMEEYSGKYSDQGSHYEVESNSDLRVFGDPPPIAENVVSTSASSCQARSLDKLRALRQTRGDCRF